MNPLSQLLVELGSIASEAGGPSEGVRVQVGELKVELPIEGRLRDGVAVVSAPRSRLRTGFDTPHGRIRARFVAELS